MCGKGRQRPNLLLENPPDTPFTDQINLTTLYINIIFNAQLHENGPLLYPRGLSNMSSRGRKRR